MDYQKQRHQITLTLVGILLLVGSLAGISSGDAALQRGTLVRFTGPTGDILVGTYIPGEQPAGVLLLEGFGADQVSMRSIASEFAQVGFHVFVFDFSGHGRSPGSLTFDNAATERLAGQALAAKDELLQRSGLRAAELIVLGHSMGARVALQAATLDHDPVRGLILFGTQVNLDTSVQAEVFTGVRDVDLPWVQALSPTSPPTNVLQLIGAWDDILPPVQARLLLSQLVGEEAQIGKRYGDLDQGTGRELTILSALLHLYETISPRALSQAKAWAQELLPQVAGVSPHADVASRRLGFWALGLIGFVVALIGGRGWIGTLPAVALSPRRIQVRSLRRFLWAKLGLWVPALPLIVLVFGVFYAVPLGVPIFNLIYVGFIGGYGLLCYILYRAGRMPGTEGRVPFGGTAGGSDEGSRALPAVGISGLSLLLLTAFVRTGWFLAPPLGMRMVSLVLFAPVTTLGFWVSLHESEIVRAAAPERKWPQIILALLGLLPFLAWTVFQAAIGSLSGIVSALQGLAILALVLMHGGLIRRLAGQLWLTALVQTVMLYWLVLPQGVLFATW